MDSPACHRVVINGEEQFITINHKTDIAQKRICALPGEHLKHGGIVEYANTHWLITEVDADNEVYERGIMQRCNHLLRWINKEGRLIEKWCIVEDGTKYLVGEFSERIMTIGDARIAVIIGKDAETVDLARGIRFIIDDRDADPKNVLAYRITKPNKFWNTFDGDGVYKFILNEVIVEDADNLTEHIANYNDWMPPRKLDSDHVDSECSVAEIVATAEEKAATPPSDDKEVWL